MLSSDKYTHLNIHGIEVFEQVEKLPTFFETETDFIPAYSYHWNFDDRHFNILISEYEQDECQKIVESMIQQLD